MPYATIITIFYLSIIFWVLSGFFNLEFSLSRVFYPVLYIVGFASFLFNISLKRKKVIYTSSGRQITSILLILILVVLFNWLFNAVSSNLPIDIKLFNLVIPLTIFTISISAWYSDVKRTDIRRILNVLFLFLFIDLVVSVFTFIGCNIIKTIPTNIFYNNPRYPVILYPIAGEAWVRTPGIFETGGSNSSFLYIFLSIIIAYISFNKDRKTKLFLLFLVILIFVIVLVVISSLTRRSIISLYLLVMLFLYLMSIDKRKGWSNIITIFVLSFGVIATYYIVIEYLPDLLARRSLYARFSFWEYNYLSVLGKNILTLFTGYGVIQSSFQFFDSKLFTVIDNSYLGLIIYGGIPLLLLFLYYLLVLFRLNLRMFKAKEFQYRWLASVNISLILYIVFVSFFIIFFTNMTESFVYFLLVNVFTRFLVSEFDKAYTLQG